MAVYSFLNTIYLYSDRMTHCDTDVRSLAKKRLHIRNSVQL